jgi:hypothetical protein
MKPVSNIKPPAISANPTEVSAQSQKHTIFLRSKGNAAVLHPFPAKHAPLGRPRVRLPSLPVALSRFGCLTPGCEAKDALLAERIAPSEKGAIAQSRQHFPPSPMTSPPPSLGKSLADEAKHPWPSEERASLKEKRDQGRILGKEDMPLRDTEETANKKQKAS